MVRDVHCQVLATPTHRVAALIHLLGAAQELGAFRQSPEVRKLKAHKKLRLFREPQKTSASQSPNTDYPNERPHWKSCQEMGRFTQPHGYPEGRLFLKIPGTQKLSRPPHQLPLINGAWKLLDLGCGPGQKSPRT